MVPLLKRVVLFLAITALTFLFVEGCSNTLIVLYEAVPSNRRLAQYDSLIGWVATPSVSIPDYYAAGKWGRPKGVHTNAQGFRNQTEITPRVAPGAVRILCSGDSFTFGQGVGDNETWCYLLAGHDERFETVNLAYPGYGTDQSYLRYARDAASLEHTIHLFAFIGGDLTRIGTQDHSGNPKPVLRLDGDSLVIDNVPVPRVFSAVQRFAIRLAKQFRSADLAKRLLTSPPTPTSVEERGKSRRERIGPLATRVLREVQRLAEERGSSAVFVYLPTRYEYDHQGPWRGWASAVMDSLGYSFIDLTPALREIPVDVVDDLFLLGGSAEGHYSRAGNAWVAEALYHHIRNLPPVLRMPDALEEPVDASP